MRFRPCIDLHNGIVKQIVGASLKDEHAATLQTNFESQNSPSWFAGLYRQDGLSGGHIIQLGPGNESAAREALAAWPGGMQIGGGIDIGNATKWLDAGAASVIVTSWVFHDGLIDEERLKKLSQKIGRHHLVLDLSCRKQAGAYMIATNRWQTLTQEKISPSLLKKLSSYCHEFLVHAVDVEGQCRGVETELVKTLAKWQELPITYAGGIASQEDIDQIGKLGQGHLDFTVGSALDLFGGKGLKYGLLAQRYN